MADSIHDKLGRVRPPRVHITYKVETGGAIEEKEIPFVVGVLADLSGKPEEPLPRLRERKFIDLDGDTFDAVLRGIQPRLAYSVDNKLADDDTKMSVELRFNSIEDFEPEQVARQIEPLRKLIEVRQRLKALLAKTDGKDRTRELLQDIIGNMQERTSQEASLETAGDTGATPPQG